MWVLLVSLKFAGEPEELPTSFLRALGFRLRAVLEYTYAKTCNPHFGNKVCSVSSSVSVSVLFPVCLPLLQGLPFSLPFCFPLAFSVPFVLPFGVPVSIWLPFSFLFSLAVSSTIREKWKTQCVYCLFSGSELKTLRFGFRTGVKTVNTLCFPLFREIGGPVEDPVRTFKNPEKSEKHSVFTVYFPVPSSQRCVLASEPEKNSKHTVFSTFS